MADRRRMELRLLRAALWRKRGTVSIAVCAVAIGGSVACALLHVSRDVSRQLNHELRALGPNLIVAPDADAAAAWLDEKDARYRVARTGVQGAALLLVSASHEGRPLSIVGADLSVAGQLHPSWRLGPGDRRTLIGVRLAKALGLKTGDTLSAEFHTTGGEARRLALPVGATLESGGADDEAWWIPLKDAQTLSGLEGRISLIQARLADPRDEVRVVPSIEAGGGIRASVVHALSSTEADLFNRMRRLMTWVTLGVLLSAGLCTFGTLTDLALERRREIALLKALGASQRAVIRQFGAESLAVGLLGGFVGWWMGLLAAHVIGREVFHASVSIQWILFPVVLALSIAVAMAAGIGPIRLALAVDPAPVLKGE
jgi:putative ABC transport system permease protein